MMNLGSVVLVIVGVALGYLTKTCMDKSKKSAKEQLFFNELARFRNEQVADEKKRLMSLYGGRVERFMEIMNKIPDVVGYVYQQDPRTTPDFTDAMVEVYAGGLFHVMIGRTFGVKFDFGLMAPMGFADLRDGSLTLSVDVPAGETYMCFIDLDRKITDEAIAELTKLFLVKKTGHLPVGV